MSISQQIRMISIRPSFDGPGGIGETYPLLKLEVTPRRWTARGMMGMCISSSLSVRFLFYVRSLTAWLDSDDHVGGNMDPQGVAARRRASDARRMLWTPETDHTWPFTISWLIDREDNRWCTTNR